VWLRKIPKDGMGIPMGGLQGLAKTGEWIDRITVHNAGAKTILHGLDRALRKDP